MPISPSPYNFTDSLALLWRNVAGPALHNPAGVSFAPHRFTLNEVHTQTRIGFAGDIMMMFGRPLSFGTQLKSFLADCSHVVANLEGVITDLPKRGPDQKHTPDILDALATLAAPEKFALSVANNHSGDFGEAACRESAARFATRGFRIFGMAGKPFVDLDDQVRVVTGTEWSNRSGEHLAWLKNPQQFRRADAINLLFPHWGHEMNGYPRQAEYAKAQEFLRHFDAVIGHHSHTPQPVSRLDTDAGPRLVAWSLGDFCFGLGHKRWPALKHYPWGVVLKIGIGPRLHDAGSRWAIGEVEWAFTDCARQKDSNGFCTEIVERVPYFTL